MVYSKPEMYVENFIPNIAVAACNREWDGTTSTSWVAQAITCGRQGKTTDYLFASGTDGCQYQPNAFGYVEVEDVKEGAGNDSKTLTPSEIATALKSTINNPNTGKSVTIYDPGAYLVIWGNHDHYGEATPEIVKNMTSSF